MHSRMGLRPFIMCSALFVASQLAPAQTKVAVISLQKAVFESAEIKKADAEMQARFKPRQDRIQQLQNDIAGIAQQLQTGGKLTPQAEADLNSTGKRKQTELQRLQEDLQADAERERNEILQKSTQKMTDVVKKLAEEKGYDLVVEASTALYFKQAMDITSDAIAAYDKKYPVAAAPTAAK